MTVTPAQIHASGSFWAQIVRQVSNVPPASASQSKGYPAVHRRLSTWDIYGLPPPPSVLTELEEDGGSGSSHPLDQRPNCTTQEQESAQEGGGDEEGGRHVVAGQGIILSRGLGVAMAGPCAIRRSLRLGNLCDALPQSDDDDDGDEDFVDGEEGEAAEGGEAAEEGEAAEKGVEEEEEEECEEEDEEKEEEGEKEKDEESYVSFHEEDWGEGGSGPARIFAGDDEMEGEPALYDEVCLAELKLLSTLKAWSPHPQEQADMRMWRQSSPQPPRSVDCCWWRAASCRRSHSAAIFSEQTCSDIIHIITSTVPS